MPLAEPIIEQIAAAIATRLATISVGATYSHTPSSIVRPTRWGGYKVIDKLITLEQTDSPSKPEGDLLSGNPPRIAWVWTFEIDFYIAVTEASTSAIDTLFNQRVADIQYALATDLTFGGLALAETNFGPPRKWAMADGNFAGGTVTLNVHYRTDETNPRVQG